MLTEKRARSFVFWRCVMTVDIRTAARAYVDANDMSGHQVPKQQLHEMFVEGAVWAQARLTPTREQVERALIGRDFITGADAILALLAGLAEGESSE